VRWKNSTQYNEVQRGKDERGELDFRITDNVEVGSSSLPGTTIYYKTNPFLMDFFVLLSEYYNDNIRV